MEKQRQDLFFNENLLSRTVTSRKKKVKRQEKSHGKLKANSSKESQENMNTARKLIPAAQVGSQGISCCDRQMECRLQAKSKETQERIHNIQF